MENSENRRIAVKTTGNNGLGTHVVDEEPVAILERHTSAFLLELSKLLGMSESWTLDHIVETYSRTFGFDPPWEKSG